MSYKLAVAIATMSALCFAKPITQHTLIDIQCPSIDVISDKAELVVPCMIQTINRHQVKDKLNNIAVRLKKSPNGIVEGRVEALVTTNCDAKAVMINFDTTMDRTNTFVALDEPSKECFLSLAKR